MQLLLPDEPFTFRNEPLKGFSDEQFFQFCQLNSDMRIERNSDKNLIIMPPAGFDSSYSSGQAYGNLFIWQRQARMGKLVDSSAGYTLPDGSILSPDASWVSAARLATISPAERKKFPHLCPDFVIEVKSPSDRLTTLQAKMEQWLNNGVRLAFLIDTETETATIYRPNQEPEIIKGFDNELSGEPVLPGFSLDLRELRPQ